MLQKVGREPTLTERTETQLLDLIVNQSLAAGEKLPSESEMGLSLGVSRTVVREAVRKLVARGVVESRNGSGVYVRSLDAGLVTQPLELLMRGRHLTDQQMLEVREAIEVTVAAVAAERATAEDIKGLEEAMDLLRDKNITRKQLVDADLEFNRRLAAATKNPLFQAISAALDSVLRDFVEKAVAKLGTAARTQSLRDHGRILAKVKAHDVEGARQAAQAELTKARRFR